MTQWRLQHNVFDFGRNRRGTADQRHFDYGGFDEPVTGKESYGMMWTLIPLRAYAVGLLGVLTLAAMALMITGR